VKTWWNALPGYIDTVQQLLDQVEQTVAEVAAQRERLHRILTK
jgi:phage shock protein A